MLVTQGASIIAARTDGAVADRARLYGRFAALATAALFIIGGVVALTLLRSFQVVGTQDAFGPSNPLSKSVDIVAGGWGTNHAAMPWTWVAPILGVAGSLLAALALHLRLKIVGILSSSLAIFGIIATAGLTLFPFLMPSSIDPKSSLTVWDASSSQLTLFIMLAATVIFLPIILAYTAWVFRVMRGPVTTSSLNRNPNAY
jgi:cytochrome d ubiquinol oxidase subunit II